MKAYTLGLYEKAMPGTLTWREKLSAAKEAGFDYVEISIDQTEEKISRVDMPKEERMELVRTMYEVGIPIRTMCVSALTTYTLGNEDPKLCQRGMDILRKCVLLADDLGIRIIMIPGYDVYYEPSTRKTQERFLENLRKITMFAAKYGVLLEMETMENDFMNTVWKAMYYVNQVDSVYLGVYPDTGNIKNAASRYHSNEANDLRSGKGHISSLHLKESKPGVFREVPYGEGHVDFQKMIDVAWEIGIRKYVTEFWYTGGVNWEADLRSANDKMRAILDQKEREEVLVL